MNLKQKGSLPIKPRIRVASTKQQTEVAKERRGKTKIFCLSLDFIIDTLQKTKGQQDATQTAEQAFDLINHLSTTMKNPEDEQSSPLDEEPSSTMKDQQEKEEKKQQEYPSSVKTKRKSKTSGDHKSKHHHHHHHHRHHHDKKEEHQEKQQNDTTVTDSVTDADQEAKRRNSKTKHHHKKHKRKSSHKKNDETITATNIVADADAKFDANSDDMIKKKKEKEAATVKGKKKKRTKSHTNRNKTIHDINTPNTTSATVASAPVTNSMSNPNDNPNPNSPRRDSQRNSNRERDANDTADHITAPPSSSLEFHSEPFSEPGAWSIHPTGRPNQNDEDSSSSFSLWEEEQNDPEVGNVRQNNNNIENDGDDNNDDNLISAELVEDKEIEEAEVFNLDSERRNRFIIFTVAAIIIAIVAVAITVPIVNKNSGNDGGETQIVVIGPTASPSVSAVPSQAPSTSRAPTSYPTTSPTSLIWQEAIAADEQQLNGLDPFILEGSSGPEGGGFVGNRVNIVDIQNTPMAERTNRTTMLIVSLGGVQTYNTPGSPLPGIFSNFVYLCGYVEGSTDNDGANSATSRDYCELASQLGEGSHGKPTAISFPLFLEQRNDGDLVLYNLTNVDSTEADPELLASEQPMAGAMAILNEAGDEIIHMTSGQICQQRFASFFPGMPSTLVSDSCVSATPPEFDEDGFPIFDPTIKRFYAFDMAGDVIVIFRAIFPFPCTCCSLYKSYNVITLSRSTPMTEIAPQLGNNIMENIDFDHGAVALNGNGTIMAYSVVDKHGTVVRHTFVSVYRMEDSVWVPMGSRLVGKEDGKDEFGHSLSFNDAGTVLAVGAPKDDSNGVDSGRVYIYEWDNGEWVLSGDLLGSIGTSFGHSIDLHPFENEILVGAPTSRVNGENSGLAHLYNLVSI